MVPQKLDFQPTTPSEWRKCSITAFCSTLLNRLDLIKIQPQQIDPTLRGNKRPIKGTRQTVSNCKDLNLPYEPERGDISS